MTCVIHSIRSVFSFHSHTCREFLTFKWRNKPFLHSESEVIWSKCNLFYWSLCFNLSSRLHTQRSSQDTAVVWNSSPKQVCGSNADVQSSGGQIGSKGLQINFSKWCSFWFSLIQLLHVLGTQNKSHKSRMLSTEKLPIDSGNWNAVHWAVVLKGISGAVLAAYFLDWRSSPPTPQEIKSPSTTKGGIFERRALWRSQFEWLMLALHL